MYVRLNTNLQKLKYQSTMRGILLLLLLLIVGCQPANPDQQLVHPPPDVTPDTATYISLNLNEVDLHILRPTGWESYKTDYGVVLTEALGTIATEGRLGGLLLHVFVHPLEDFNRLPAREGANHAWTLLNAITHSPDYIGEALVSKPVPFTWNGQDAAYYLTHDGGSSVTIVIGVIAPGTQRLVAYNISAPTEEADRIRAMLPAMLDSVTINGITFPGAELDSLPDPLAFPG